MNQDITPYKDKKVTVSIEGVLTPAIVYEEDGYYYLLQSVKDGSRPSNLFDIEDVYGHEYRYSWTVGDGKKEQLKSHSVRLINDTDNIYSNTMLTSKDTHTGISISTDESCKLKVTPQEEVKIKI